jgi:V/A-type H+-transporting ATPase subunit A
LPEREKVVLDIARMLREDFLQQNAFHEIDTYCSLPKQYKMLSIILKFYEAAMLALEAGMEQSAIGELPVVDDIAKMKFVEEKSFDAEYKRIVGKIDELKTKRGD